MRFRVLLAPTARAEIGNVHADLLDRAPAYADRWLARLQDRLRSLRQMPRRCAYAPEHDEFAFELRQLLFDRYRILFTIEEDVVLVTHVHHQSRDRINVELGPEHDGP